MSEPNNILPPNPGAHKKEQLSEERLMAYMEGKLTASEQHELEQWLADEGMESDAIEGLNGIGPEETRQIVNKLNHKLHKAIASRKKKRKPLTANIYTVLAIGIILMLAILSFLIIKMIK